jgi:uncharacterized protein (DUF1697 family)
MAKVLKTYIVLLRGVMPVGKNKVPMAQLRQVLTDAGFKDVRTYIQSGNVILRTSMTARELEKNVHDLIKKYIGPDLIVIVKTESQIRRILNGNPLKKSDMSRVFYTMFAKKPPAQKVRELLSQDCSPGEIVFSNNVAYVYIPGNYTRSQLDNNSLEKILGTSATTRNINTMKKLAEMSNT